MSLVSGGKALQLVDVGVEDAVREAYTGRLVGVGVGELDVDFPEAAFEGCYGLSASVSRSVRLSEGGSREVIRGSLVARV